MIVCVSPVGRRRTLRRSALGVAMENIAVGMGLGIGIGMALSIATGLKL